MVLRRLAVLATCSVLFVAVGATQAEAAPSGHGCRVPPVIASKLDAIVAAVRQMSVPGVAVAVDQPGTGAYVVTSGTRDGHRRVNAETKFRIGSITKTFTATEILILVDRGLLSLDDTLDRWQPKVQYADRISIRMLLNMTSGIFDEGGPGSLLVALANQTPLRVWAPQEIVDLAIQQGPVAPPPSPWYYSDANYVILGMIAQAVTGTPINVLIEHDIIRPLHLTGTSYPTDPAIPAPAATGFYAEIGEGYVPATVYDPSLVGAAGAMISTLKDLQVWAPVFATGALLSPRLRHERLPTIPTGVEFGPLPGFGTQPLPVTYGLGIADAGGYLGHNGVVPGFTTEMWFNPTTRTTIVVMLNANVFNDALVAVDIADQTFVSIAEALPPDD
jgi:D-alanyl-D-alanine carboxypeptidase